jgi:hypothetical protein
LEEDLSISRELIELLGEPHSKGCPQDIWGEVEREFHIEVPVEVRDFLDAYGGVRVSGYLSIFSPGALTDCQRFFGETVSGVSKIVDPMLPVSGGMFIWGSTVEADLLFMVQRRAGWRVAAWVRQWHEWYESDMPLMDWALLAFSNSQDIDWLPEWNYPIEVANE